MAVARPASATAPFAPDGKIAFRAASCCAVESSSSVAGSEFIIALSIQRSGAQFVGLARRDSRAPIAPGGADIGHYGCHLVVGKGLREGRHAVGHRIARRSRWKAAVENHADRIY